MYERVATYGLSCKAGDTACTEQSVCIAYMCNLCELQVLFYDYFWSDINLV
jgi:hypothetical protein